MSSSHSRRWLGRMVLALGGVALVLGLFEGTLRALSSGMERVPLVTGDALAGWANRPDMVRRRPARPPTSDSEPVQPRDALISRRPDLHHFPPHAAYPNPLTNTPDRSDTESIRLASPLVHSPCLPGAPVVDSSADDPSIDPPARSDPRGLLGCWPSRPVRGAAAACRRGTSSRARKRGRWTLRPRRHASRGARA